MSRSLLLILIVVLLIGCSPSGPEAESASVSSTMSTNPATTSTSTSPATTTTTSTTIPPPITTTIPTLEGNWARLPVVAYNDWSGMALGWWDGTSWVQAEEGGTLPADGAKDYQIALIGTEAVIRGGAPENRGCEVLDFTFPSVEFEDGDLLSSVIDDGAGGERTISGVAVSAPWDITPRPVAVGGPRPEMETAALELLAERGFDRTTAPIVQVVEGDLEGDGSSESVVVAEDTELSNSISDVYSLVFVLSGTDPTPVVVAESAFPRGEEGFPASFRVSSLADINGDGTLEVVMSGEAWENGWVSVYERSGDRYEHRITAGCGV